MVQLLFVHRVCGILMFYDNYGHEYTSGTLLQSCFMFASARASEHVKIDVLTNLMFLKIFLIIRQLNIGCKGEMSHAISEPLDSIYLKVGLRAEQILGRGLLI